MHACVFYVCLCMYVCIHACMCVLYVSVPVRVCVCVYVYTRFPRHSGRDDDDIGILQGPIQLFRTKVACHLRRKKRSHPA